MEESKFVRPLEQETFESTGWVRKRMKKRYKTKNTKKNGGASEELRQFDIYYRFVDVNKKRNQGSRAGEQKNDENLATKKKFCSQKSPANPVFVRGTAIWYGNPISIDYPRPPLTSLDADDHCCDYSAEEIASESVVVSTETLVTDIDSEAGNRSAASASKETNSVSEKKNSAEYCGLVVTNHAITGNDTDSGYESNSVTCATNPNDSVSFENNDSNFKLATTSTVDSLCLDIFGKLPSEVNYMDVSRLSEEECKLVPTCVKDAIFSNLPSIQSVRKSSPRLNIGFDTEFCYVDEEKKTRAILSYQFACFLADEHTILEVSFVSTNPVPENRLSLSTCLGYVLELVDNSAFTSFKYSVGRTYHVDYDVVKEDGTTETVRKIFSTQEDAERFIESDEFKDEHLMVTLDKSHIKSYCNLRQFTSKAFDISVVCHTGSVDLTAFANDKFSFWKKAGSIIPYLKSVQGGAISLDDYYLPISKGSEPWKFYPVNITFRDTMCYAPEKNSSLAALGKTVGVEKIRLAETKDEEDAIKSDMLTYMREQFYDFLSYGAEDSLITLLYGSKLWGVNKDWCVTSTSGATAVGKKVICEYLGVSVDKKGKYSPAEFNRKFRGLKTVSCGMEETAYGFKRKTETVCVSSERENLYRYASKAFSGGFNMSSLLGVYSNILTWDFDLCNAYPTGLCCIADIDYDNPDGCIERVFFNEKITIGAFHSPCDPLFAVIDYEFPEECLFPCIAKHCDGTVIFPRKGKDVYASGPSIYLALQLGATVHVRSGFMAKVRYREPMQKSFSLRAVMKQLVNDRTVTKKLFGKGSLEDNTIKNFSNAFYGKVAQNVVEKNTWDGWNEEMENLGLSSVTNPELACLVTDVVRCMLIGTLNELVSGGHKAFSATTDGFITNASLDELNRCENFGFRRMFEQCRLFLSDGQDPTIWEPKHAQEFLLNTTTRCNTGFGYGEYKGVNAHGGYKTGLDEDTLEDRREMLRVITQRTGSVAMKYTRFVSLKEMQRSRCDFHTTEEEKKLRFNFDMKRKPVKDSFEKVTGSFLGIDYEYMNFDTVPFEDDEEFLLYRSVSEGFSCLRTEKEWKQFWLRIKDKENGTRHNLSDMDWNALFAVIAGYRAGKWLIPGLEECGSVKEKLDYINARNRSGRVFKQDNWKDCRKPERQAAAIYENIDGLLEEFGAIVL